MALSNGERQVSPTLDGIRADHKRRYEWAAGIIGAGRYVIDVACGVGYGSKILADAGNFVTAIDCNVEAIEYAKQHYAHKNIKYVVADANNLVRQQICDYAVCFETLEHLEDPAPLLKSLHCAATLLASVPNQERMPWRGQKFHFRHYTKSQFAALLEKQGYEVEEWLGQEGRESAVVKGMNGRTRIVIAKRSVVKRRSGLGLGEKVSSKKSKLVAVKPFNSSDVSTWPVPERVAILGLGPSLNTYVGLVKRLGGRHRLCDEVWGLNAVGDVLRCDRIFAMDDVRIQQIRADADPSGNIAAMLPWMKKHPSPIYTSRAHPDYPTHVEYPLADVLNACGGRRYINSTAAYAAAYAIFIGVKKMLWFGADFSYPAVHHAERGRGCLESWLGFAEASGIELSFPKDTTLYDSYVEPRERLYGYDTVDVIITGDTGSEVVTLVPRDVLPTAVEIESRYDHTVHTIPDSILNGKAES